MGGLDGAVADFQRHVARVMMILRVGCLFFFLDVCRLGWKVSYWSWGRLRFPRAITLELNIVEDMRVASAPLPPNHPIDVSNPVHFRYSS